MVHCIKEKKRKRCLRSDCDRREGAFKRLSLKGGIEKYAQRDLKANDVRRAARRKCSQVNGKFFGALGSV